MPQGVCLRVKHERKGGRGSTGSNSATQFTGGCHTSQLLLRRHTRSVDYFPLSSMWRAFACWFATLRARRTWQTRPRPGARLWRICVGVAHHWRLRRAIIPSWMFLDVTCSGMGRRVAAVVWILRVLVNSDVVNLHLARKLERVSRVLVFPKLRDCNVEEHVHRLL